MFSDKAVPTHAVAERKRMSDKMENDFELTEGMRNTLLKGANSTATALAKREPREIKKREEAEPKHRDETASGSEFVVKRTVTVVLKPKTTKNNNNSSSGLKSSEVIEDSDEMQEDSDFDFDDASPKHTQMTLRTKKMKL